MQGAFANISQNYVAKPVPFMSWLIRLTQTNRKTNLVILAAIPNVMLDATGYIALSF